MTGDCLTEVTTWAGLTVFLNAQIYFAKPPICGFMNKNHKEDKVSLH